MASLTRLERLVMYDANPRLENTSTSSNNTGTTFNNNAINYGQQIGEVNHKYWNTIYDATSYKSLALSSFIKYQNLRLDETCEWLLKEESYKAWAECRGSCVQISGKMGCGKSTLVARAIEDIQERKIERGQRMLYFFASSLSDVEEGRLKDVQPTLKKVLLTFWDQLHDDEDGGIGHGNTRDLSETELVAGIVGKLMASETTHISILIDAIDTLSLNDKEKLYSTLLKDCRKHKIQISLLTSYTRTSTTPTANGEIRVTPDKNREDMERFVRAKLSEKMLQRDEAGEGEKEEVEEIMKKIMERAQEMFQWAAAMTDIVCRAYDKEEREQVLERLLLPKYIQDNYEKLVEGWEGKTWRGGLDEWQRKLAQQVTGLLTHKEGLVSWGALMEVLKEELWETAAQGRTAQVVLDCCSPFIEYDVELCIFRFAHPSMHEFFLKRDTSRTAFADQTLAYLCRPAFRRGPFPDAEWRDMGELHPFLKRHPFLGFAAVNWVEAVRNSKAESTRNLLTELYRSEENLLLAFQVYRIADHDSLPAHIRSIHIFSFFGLLDDRFDISSHVAAVADSDGRNALHWALYATDAHTRLQTARILMRADNLMAARDKADLTPLHHAARQGDLGMVYLLLGHDPDQKSVLNFCSAQYGTPLIMAAAHGHVDVVKELIKAGADLDVKWEPGNVLHAAAAADAPDKAAHACVEAILRKHPCPSQLDIDYLKQEGTPLHTAAYHGRESVVKLLLDADFSARKRSWKHRSTITAAAAGCHRGTDPEPFLRIMKMLYDAGAEAHAAGTTGYFALHHAAHFNQPEIARFLHNCGANCHQKSTIGTPLEVAAAQGHMIVVRVLLQPREERQRAYIKRQAEKERKKKEEEMENNTSREGSSRRTVFLAVWEPVWRNAIAANDMTRIYNLINLYEQRCDTAIQQKTLWVVKSLATMGTLVFASIVRLMERRPQRSQQKPKPGPHLRRRARQVLSSTTSGMLKLHAVYDTTIPYFQLKVHNQRLLRSASVAIEFHPGVYEEILDHFILAAVRLVTKALEHDNLDAVPPLAEALINALLAIDSAGLLQSLIEKRAHALKLILTDNTRTAAEKRRDVSILDKAAIELLAVALQRSHRDGDARAATLTSSLASLWASALHDAGGPDADSTRVEDAYYICSAFVDLFEVACQKPPPSSYTSADDDRRRSERVCLLAQVGAEIVVESVRTDNDPLINSMRCMMGLSRKAAASAGLKDAVEKVLMEKHDSLEEAGRITLTKDEGSNNKSNTRESGEHQRGEGSEGDVLQDESSEGRDGNSETDEEAESRRLRITLRILRGDEGVITEPDPVSSFVTFIV